MKNRNVLGYCIAAASLAACGGESDTNAPDLNINITTPPPVVVVGEPEADIVNTSLPIEEDFDGSGDTLGFFSVSYKSLATENDNDADDNFYYSAAGLFNADGSVADPQNTWITTDADAGLRFGNSRWTIGQTVSDLGEFVEGEGGPRNKSTPGSGLANSESWGELDLSSPYSISFCVVAAEGSGQLQVYVDNNTSSAGASIHADASRLYNVSASTLTAGERITIDSDVGTEHSFIQFRVSSGGAIVIDDLIIENAGAPAATPPDCSTKTTEFLSSQTVGGEEELSLIHI